MTKIFLFLCIGFFSCASPGLNLLGGLTIVLEVDDTGLDAAELKNVREKCIAIYKNRLHRAYETCQVLVQAEGEKGIYIEIPGAEDEAYALQILQRSVDLSFCETMPFPALASKFNLIYEAYGTELPPLSTLRFAVNDENGYYSSSSPLIGMARANDTAAISSFLSSDSIQEILGNDFDMLWSAKPVDSLFELIAIKTGKNAKLTSDIIAKVDADFNSAMSQPVVDIMMTEEGGDKWGDFTENNVGLCIAMVVDGRVYSYPRVNEAIYAGRTQISGNMTIEETKELALLLNSGSLPAKVSVISVEHSKPR